MKTSLIAALLCLVPSLTASAEDVRWNGTLYKLQTVNPVAVDGFGRIIPLRPMTVLVPVNEALLSQAKADTVEQTQLSPVPSPVAERQSVVSGRTRFANLQTTTPDVPRPIGRQSASQPRTFRAADADSGHEQQLADTADVTFRSSNLRDSRLHRRNVY